MSTKTTIEWTDATWNPVRGCSVVSAGCKNCYAMKVAYRFSKPGMPYEGLTYGPRWNGEIRIVHEALEEPLQWKRPRRVFVNSMSDLFHEDIPFSFIHSVFGTMRQTPQHTYQILTKRPDRMRQFIAEYLRPRESLGWWNGFYKHVWLGVSVEDQESADKRIPILLQTPSAVRFISAEPLLSNVSIIRYLYRDLAVTGDFRNHKGQRKIKFTHNGTLGALHWTIIGGESGPGARPCDLAWLRSIKYQCESAAVPVFVKQLGAQWYDRDARVGIRGSVAVPLDRPWLWVTQRDRKGGDFDDSEFPADLRVREFPKG